MRVNDAVTARRVHVRVRVYSMHARMLLLVYRLSEYVKFHGPDKTHDHPWHL